MYSKLKEILDIVSHISDFKEGEYPKRTYLSQILCTIYSAKMNYLISESQKKRWIDGMSNKNDMIELTLKIADEINNLAIMPMK